MTLLLEKAFAEAAKLPAPEQDQLARQILTQLAQDQLWEDSFAQSQALLTEWAAQARAEHRAGKTIAIDREQRKREIIHK